MKRLDQIVSTNIEYYNQVNYVVDNEMKFDSRSTLETSTVKDPLSVATTSLIV